MAVLAGLQRLFLHHPLTKSHIEEAVPGTARETRGNTKRNRMRAPRAAAAADAPSSASETELSADAGGECESRSTSAASSGDAKPVKIVAFTPQGDVIGADLKVDINFSTGRRRRRRAPPPDPAHTPFLDSFTLK